MTGIYSSLARLQSLTGANQNGSTGTKSEQLIEDQQDFEVEMLEKLAGAQARFPGADIMGQMSGSNAFPGASFQFMNVDIEGIERVWAEQLKSPTGLMGIAGGSNGSSDHTSALDSVIMLTVREQMTRVTDIIQRRVKALEDSVDVDKSDEIQRKVNASYTNVAQFTEQMEQQYDEASKQLGISVLELKRRVNKIV